MRSPLDLKVYLALFGRRHIKRGDAYNAVSSSQLIELLVEAESLPSGLLGDVDYRVAANDQVFVFAVNQ